MSQADKGTLIELFLVALEHDNNGSLPSFNILFKYFPSFCGHKKTFENLLASYCLKGWLDYDVANDTYKIHNWGKWQFESDNSAPRVAKYKAAITGNNSTNKSTFARNDLLNPLELSSVGNGIQRTEIKNSPEVDNFEAGINDFSLPKDQPKLFDDISSQKLSKPKSKALKPIPENNSDARLKPVREYLISCYWEMRGIPLNQVSDKSDWIALSDLLRRTKSSENGVFSVGAICAAWARFLGSESKWHKSQGHPVRFFCSNIAAFLSGGVASDTGKYTKGAQEIYDMLSGDK